MHAAKERMVGLEKDVSLCSCQFNNTLLEYFVLTDRFDSKLLIRTVQSGQEDTTKAPSTNLLHQVKIFKCDVSYVNIFAYQDGVVLHVYLESGFLGLFFSSVTLCLSNEVV